jgi:hypothetical protein
MPTSTSTTHPASKPEARCRCDAATGHAAPHLPRRGTCTARRKHSSSKRSFSRPKARRPASASSGARGMNGVCKAPSHRYIREPRRNAPPTQGARRSRSGSLTRAGKPKTVTPATSSTPGGQATRRRGRRRATTLDGVCATIARRTVH